MIRFSVIDDRESLIKLWTEVFGDSFDAVDLFFKYHYKPDNTVVFVDGNRIVSMLYLLEGNFVISQIKYPSYYLYAAATAEDYRGKGIMGRMLGFAEEKAKKSGKDFICLLPAEDSLYGFYSKYGYKSVFKKKTVNIKNGTKNVCDRVDSNLDVVNIRNEFLSNYDFFEWDKNAVEYAFKQNEFYGGNIIVDCDGYCLYSENDGLKVIKEFAFKNGFLPIISESCVVNMPADYPIDNSDCVISENGMALPLNIGAETSLKKVENAYLGLTLD